MRPMRTTGLSRMIGLTVPASLILMLLVCSWSTAHEQERHGDCEDPYEVIAIYDCKTGLVLWSKGSPGSASDKISERELCRLVAGPNSPQHVAGQCL